MEFTTILGVAFSLAVTGFGLGVGLRLLSLRRSWAWAGDGVSGAGVNDDGLGVSPASLPVQRLSQPVGARRTTSIHGINRHGYLRHTDGGYTRGYEVRMPATLYSEEADLERLYHDWARTLQSLKQPGCVLQLRHEVWPDNGRALRAHLQAQAAPEETYLAARMLHTLGLSGTEAAARAGRSAQNQVAYQELLLEQDTEFSEAVYQREIAYGRLARAEEAQTKLEEALTRETSKPPDEQQGVESLLEQLSDVKLYIAQLTQQIADYSKIINDKMVQFGVKFDAHARFGAAVQRETEAWAEMTRLNEQTLQSLGALFDPDNPAVEVFEFDEEDYEPFTLH